MCPKHMTDTDLTWTLLYSGVINHLGLSSVCLFMSCSPYGADCTVPINKKIHNKATGTYDLYDGRVEKLPTYTHVHLKLESPKSPSIMTPAMTETPNITTHTQKLDCQLLYCTKAWSGSANSGNQLSVSHFNFTLRVLRQLIALLQ